MYHFNKSTKNTSEDEEEEEELEGEAKEKEWARNLGCVQCTFYTPFFFFACRCSAVSPEATLRFVRKTYISCCVYWFHKKTIYLIDF